MYIDEGEFRKMLVYVLETFRSMEHELVAYQAVIRELCKSSEIGDELQRVLCDVRSSPALLSHLREKYDTVLEALRVVAQNEKAHENRVRTIRGCAPN